MTGMLASGVQAVPRRRLLAAMAAIAGLLATLLAVVPALPAEAADPGEFDPGYIISDALMYDGSAMTEAQIQDFLASKSGSCSNSRCLDILKVDTTDKPASTTCAAYEGRDNESVARILYRMQGLCDVSAKVLLVLMQKEQGLITSTGPSTAAIKYATGYGCPDTPSGCETKYNGIDNQIYWAARAFGWYRVNPSDGHEVRTQKIKYHPSSSCGTKTVAIRNEATAALYNYTPYTPNDAALDNMYGTGNSCSSYGNRNFWRYYTDWFGSPIGKLSSAVEKERVAGDDRYQTSAAVSASAYPSLVPEPDPEADPELDPAEESERIPTVFIASGENFPDGLAAGPAAALAGAPLLLTKKNELPAVIKAEIQRLAPQRIVIVGGTPAVSKKVETALKALASQVIRLAGDDRQATARAIARYAFPNGAEEVFIAIGDNFPDALAASGAAGHEGIPVILVPSRQNSVDSATKKLLKELGAVHAYVAGSPAVIKTSYLKSLTSDTVLSKATRLGGATRYQTAAIINSTFYSEATMSYLVSGENFPDALSAAAPAGAQGAPLHLSPGKCLPSWAVSHLTVAGVKKLVFVGSAAVLNKNAWAYKPC